MNKDFMKDFYNNFYEDPNYIATESDEEYIREKHKHTEMVSELAKILGGFDSGAWKKYEECMNQANKAQTIMALDMYLMGAADREKMLQ